MFPNDRSPTHTAAAPVAAAPARTAGVARGRARSLVVDLTVLGLLVVVAAGLLVAWPPAQAAFPAFFAGVGLYAAARRITFSAGEGTATPLQLVFVPLWFWFDPALIVPVALAGEVLAEAVGVRLSGTRPAWLGAASRAWPAVVPAVAMGTVGVAAPSMADAAVVVVAVLGQSGVAWAVSRLRAGGEAEAPRRAALVVAAAVVVDLALAILGLELAIVAEMFRTSVVLVVPFMLLLAHFSREREHRLTHALELSSAYRGTAALMADVLEADDEYTGGEHTQDVVELALRTGEALGLDVAAMRRLEFGALLHDVGKLRVPNDIINKPGRLTAHEWTIIRRHPEIGEAMLRRVGGVLADAAPIVRGHHERFDGGGYPDGLVGEAIPVEARVITVCDAYSAMTTTRSYRQALSPHEAVAELHRCTPGQFDPAVVGAFVAGLDLDPDASLRVAGAVRRAATDAIEAAGTDGDAACAAPDGSTAPAVTSDVA